jgi:hypothetical protein
MCNGDFYRTEISKIRAMLINGVINYDEAQELAKPIISEMNKKAAEIAKKFGKKPYKFTFGYLMR